MPVIVRYENACPDGTPIDLFVELSFRASGCFGAENCIHFQATVYSNVSNLLNHVNSIAFSGAFLYNKSLGYSSDPYQALLPLSQVSDRIYFAEGDLIWHQSEKAYVLFYPPFNGTILQPLAVSDNNSPVIDISPVSDTLTVRTNNTIEKLTYVLTGLTIIMLHPIFASLLLDKRSKR